MAEVFPSLVKTVTASTGTNDYVVSTVPSTGSFRTLKQAVAAGDLSNGDTVLYIVRDTTVTGSDIPANPLFEIGTGIYTDATDTVARLAANVIEGSAGVGTLVSWPVSGQRDFYLINAPDPARLGSENVFTEDQTIERAAAKFTLRDGTNVGTFEVAGAALDIRKISSALIARIDLNPIPDSGQNARIRLMRSTDTGAGTAQTEFHKADGTATVMAFVDHKTGDAEFENIQSSDGNPYEHFPSGTILLFGTAPPVGWTRIDVGASAATERIIRLSQSGDSAGDTAGSWTISGLTNGVTGSHTLTVAQLPAHDHLINSSADSGGALTRIVRTTTASTSGTVTSTQNAGSGFSHNHTGSTISSAGTWRPVYEVWIKASKD